MSINPDELINVEGFGGRTPFERPVPGQSLTNDPDTKYAWEQPPKYTDVSSAIDYLLYEGDSYESYDEDDDLNEQKSLEVLGKIKQDSSDRLKFKDLKPSQITKQSVPEEALEMVENFEPPQELVSLLAKRKEENNNSLLERA